MITVMNDAGAGADVTQEWDDLAQRAGASPLLRPSCVLARHAAFLGGAPLETIFPVALGCAKNFSNVSAPPVPSDIAPKRLPTRPLNEKDRITGWPASRNGPPTLTLIRYARCPWSVPSELRDGGRLLSKTNQRPGTELDGSAVRSRFGSNAHTA